MKVRKGYRRYHRCYKRYRKARFDNRKSLKKKDRISPGIFQKRQATMRVILKLNKWIRITNYWLEDVKINIRALIDGYKPYKWEYQKSNRLDENIRKAVIMRDGYKCMECGTSNTIFEVHHIKPRRMNGSNTLGNLITLCRKCHQKTEGKEEQFMSHYFSMLGSSNIKNLNYANHVMIGKTWLREQLSNIGALYLTTGCDTANKRIDWDVNKSHSNDAVCITALKPDNTHIKEWIIKPMRRQSKAIADNVLGIKHRDLVEYRTRTGTRDIGYVTALYPSSGLLNFTSNTGKIYKKVSAKSCRVIWRFSKIYWLQNFVA